MTARVLSQESLKRQAAFETLQSTVKTNLEKVNNTIVQIAAKYKFESPEGQKQLTEQTLTAINDSYFTAASEIEKRNRALDAVEIYFEFNKKPLTDRKAQDLYQRIIARKELALINPKKLLAQRNWLQAKTFLTNTEITDLLKNEPFELLAQTYNLIKTARAEPIQVKDDTEVLQLTEEETATLLEKIQRTRVLLDYVVSNTEYKGQKVPYFEKKEFAQLLTDEEKHNHQEIQRKQVRVEELIKITQKNLKELKLKKQEIDAVESIYQATTPDNTYLPNEALWEKCQEYGLLEALGTTIYKSTNPLIIATRGWLDVSRSYQTIAQNTFTQAFETAEASKDLQAAVSELMINVLQNHFEPLVAKEKENFQNLRKTTQTLITERQQLTQEITQTKIHLEKTSI